jgi:hypothetical protein
LKKIIARFWWIVPLILLICFIKIPVFINVDGNAVGFDWHTEEYVSDHTVKMRGTLWLSVLGDDKFKGYCFIDSGMPSVEYPDRFFYGYVHNSDIVRGKDINLVRYTDTFLPVGRVFVTGYFKNAAIMRNYYVEGSADKEDEIIVFNTETIEEAKDVWHKMLKSE